jgi:hypothetical protein
LTATPPNRQARQVSTTHPEDQPLYQLWQLASSKGYSLHFNGDSIDLVPRSEQVTKHTVMWHDTGLKEACAWLEKVTPPRYHAPDNEQPPEQA